MKSTKGYFLNIYNRNLTVELNQSGEFEQSKSWTGHFYLGLQNGEDEKLFGYYPAGNVFIGNPIIHTDQEEQKHDNIKEYSKQIEKDHIFAKKIRLTEEQYQRAMDYAIEHTELKGGLYVVGALDCIDFTQSVYNSAGLPLYFTTAYSKQELDSLDTLASKSTLLRYSSRDNIKVHLSSVEGGSREQVASMLNVAIEKVIPISSEVHHFALPASDLPRFRISLDDSDLIPLESILEITPDHGMSLSLNTSINEQITAMVKNNHNLSAEMKEALLNSVEQSNRDIKRIADSIKEVKQQINLQMKKSVDDYLDELEKPDNKLAKFGFSQEEINIHKAKVTNIMTNYEDFKHFYQVIKERTEMKLALSDIPEDINRFKSIIYNPDAIIEFYECGLIKQIEDLPQDQKLLDKVFEYEVGIVFMKENSVISNLEDLCHKISDIEEISSFQKMALKSIEILESIGNKQKALEVKFHLLISTLPTEEQTNQPKILDIVKNSGDIALLGYCQEFLIQEENGNGDV